MTESEKLLLKRALWDATCSAYLKELDSCEEDACFSAAHAEKMNVILGAKPARTQAIGRPKKRTVIAAILAAALLLTGCAVYVYREKIADFIVTIFNDHVEIVHGNADSPEYPDEIEEKYILGYVPEGYKIVNKISSTLTSHSHTWKKDNGESILFYQSVVGGIIGVDSEHGEGEVLNVCGQTVYYRRAERFVYIWNDGKYSLLLTASEEIPLEEFEKIMQGIKTE